MNYQEEYKEELQKVQDRDFTHNWVSSSAFLFYLQVACIVAFVLGGCYMLYTKRFDKPDVKVQESTYHAAAVKLQDSINHYTSTLAERKQIARSNERQIYILIGITALLMVLLVFGLLRLRKKTKQS